MPDFTGMDVLVELRRRSWASGVPVLILSAYANLLAVRRAGPVAGVLPKPLDVSELLLAVDRALTEAEANTVSHSQMLSD
jgi:DNA-binding response OmpR family regulator